MLDEGVLFEHYERTLKPRVRALEKHREALLRAWKNAALATGIPGFVLYLTAGSHGRARALAWIAGVALVAGIAFAVRPFLGDSTLSWQAYRERFKRDVVSQVFRLVLPQATYVAKAGITRATFDESGLFTTRVDRFASDDLVRGRIGAVPFEAADVQASYTTGSGKNRKTWDVLRGLYLRLDFNKHLRGRTIVEPESAPAWRMGNRAGLQKVALEDPDFERRYAVFSTDAIEARYVLTPLLMERILSLEAQAGHPLHLAFVGNHVQLAVHYGRALFEPSLMSSVSYEAVVEMARLFGLAEVIVSELDLNLRIWSKAAGEDESVPEAPAAVGARQAVATGARPMATPGPRTAAAPRPARTAGAERRPLGFSRQEILEQLPRLPGAGLAGGHPFWRLSNLIGFGVGLAAYSLVAAAMRPILSRTDQGIVIFIVGSMAALVAWVGYMVLIEASQGRRRQVLYILGIVVFWFGFVVPLQR